MSHTAKQLLTLAEHDPVMADWIEKEKHRQWSGLEMVCLVLTPTHTHTHTHTHTPTLTHHRLRLRT